MTDLYQMLLYRDSETVGLNFWVAQIDQSHVTCGEALVQMLHSLEGLQLAGAEFLPG